MTRINLKKIENLQVLTFKNLMRLHKDSLYLFEVNSYPSAYYLSMVAQEELGKVFMIDNILWYVITENAESSFIELIIKDLYSHRHKQLASIEDKFKYKNKVLLINKGITEIKKQNSIYVGLYNKNLKGKILSPFKVNKKAAYSQIRFVNKLLFEIADRKIKQQGYWDNEKLDNLFNKKLLNQLRAWSINIASYDGYSKEKV